MQTHGVIARILIHESERSIRHAFLIECALMGVFIILLVVESFIIFEPMGKRISESVRRAEVSEQVAHREAARAQQANAAKSNFLRTMSHELRTPLNAIMGMNSLLSSSKLDDEQRSYAAHIERASDHMLMLANDILTINQHAAGRLTIAKQPTNIAEEIRSVADLLKPQAAEQSLSLILENNALLTGQYETDKQRFRQVMYNLVGNAIKFTDRGEIRIIIDADNTNDGVLLSLRIKDTGCGIPEDKQERIFEEFEQADNTGERAHGGAGLGLAISRNIVNALGGELTLEHSSPEGSTFLAVLPLKRVEKKLDAPQAKNTDSPVDADQHTILIVDDAATNRKIAAAFLKKAGYRTAFAENGQQAVDLMTDSQDFFDDLDGCGDARSRWRQSDGTAKSHRADAPDCRLIQHTPFLKIETRSFPLALTTFCKNQRAKKPFWNASINIAASTKQREGIPHALLKTFHRHVVSRRRCACLLLPGCGGD